MSGTVPLLPYTPSCLGHYRVYLFTLLRNCFVVNTGTGYLLVLFFDRAKVCGSCVCVCVRVCVCVCVCVCVVMLRT